MVGRTFRVYVQRNWDLITEIFFVQEDSDGRAVGYFDKTGTLTFEKIVQGGKARPTLKIDDVLLREFVDELTKEVPPIKKEVADAQLIATKYHLEDMRKLVFKGEK
jgi:hypothetical protein